MNHDIPELRNCCPSCHQIAVDQKAGPGERVCAVGWRQADDWCLLLLVIAGQTIAEAGEELASHGCIVVPKYVREQIAVYVTEGDDQLTVTP